MKRFKLLIGLASVFMFLLFSCTKDEAVGNTITEEQTENRALETALSGIDNSQNITTDCGEMQMANTEILVSGPKVKTSAVNQIKLSQFYQKMLESNTFLWDSNFQKIYGVPFFDMGLYFENSNNTFIKLPVFDGNKNKVTSFFTVLKVSDRVFEYSFIDRSFHELAFAANPSDPINAKNQTLFRLFDYGVCNEQVPPDITGGNSESPDCITGTGTVAVLMQVDCQDAGCNDCPGTCYGEENVDYVTYGPCYGSSNSSGSNGSGSGSGYGGGGGYYGNNSNTGSTNSVSAAISLHNSLSFYYNEYLEGISLMGYSSFEEMISNLGPVGSRYGNYLRVANAYKDVMIATQSEPDIAPVVAYILKKCAEFGAGAVIDFSLQLTMEYWMGDHSSFTEAFEALDVNEWQVLASGFEALIKKKYVSIAASAFNDLMLYIIETPVDNITPSGIFSKMAFGALSGFIGNSASEYVGKIGSYMVKYGPQKPFNKLKDLGIAPFFFNLKDFRELVIEKAWANPSWVGRGRALEEIQSYGRYSNMTWVNAAGETGGPIDYLLNGLGVQLKTTAATSWNGGVKANAIAALDQLKQAKIAGSIQSGRLDLMMPSSQSAKFAEYEELIRTLISTNYQDLNLTVEVGSFIQ